MNSFLKKHTTSCKKKAMARAKILHRSHHYSRVEVKKLVCNDNDICTVRDAYRVFEANKSYIKGWQLDFVALFVLGLIFALVAELIVFF
jgi:hypothetical protein